uniref:MYND-type domain-containing protein n=1 Tax=Mycena chlorophos TaxID=658473 RepID=A0ABQ0L4S0_MYCCL|nr:predicted protein [Mycena chlorophos]
MTRVTLISHWTSRCSNCGHRTPTLKCSGCRISRYCDADCQKKDWPLHKQNCKEHKESLDRIEDTTLAACVQFFSRYTDEWRIPFAQWGLFAANYSNQRKKYLKNYYFAILLEEPSEYNRATRRAAFDVAVAGMFPNTCFQEMIPSAEHAPAEHAEFVHDFEALENTAENLRIVLMSSVVCTVFSVHIRDIFPPSMLGWLHSPSACDYFKDIFDEEFKEVVGHGNLRTASNRVKELFTFISTGEIGGRRLQGGLVAEMHLRTPASTQAETAVETIPFEDESAVWARLKKTIQGAANYQVGLLFNNEFWYASKSTSTHAPFPTRPPPIATLPNCVIHRASGDNTELKAAAEYPVVPSAEEMQVWEDIDKTTQCNVVCNTDIPKLGAGCRVSISAHVKDGISNGRRSGFVTDVQGDGLCRVRVRIHDNPIDVFSSTLTSDLLTTPTRGDEVVVDEDDVRLHFLAHNVLPGIGDRVIVVKGAHSQRVGCIDYQQHVKSGSLVGIRSGDVAINNIAAAHIAHLFLPGDSVKIVYGHFAGQEGFVTRTFSLNWKNVKAAQVPAGGIQVQICKDGSVILVETISQWVRFSQRPSTNETYKDNEHWLSRWDFSGKRLDVRIGASRRGRPSKVQQTYQGMDGFIEPKERVLVGKENGLVDVIVEQTAKRVRLQAEWLEPIHNPNPPHGRLPDKQKAETMVRVVIIGADMSGSLRFMGKYGFVEKDAADKTHVLVKAVSEAGGRLGEATYATENLCRATNVDGYSTKATVF